MKKEINYVDARTPEEKERDKKLQESAVFTTTASQEELRAMGFNNLADAIELAKKEGNDYPH